MTNPNPAEPKIIEEDYPLEDWIASLSMAAENMDLSEEFVSDFIDQLLRQQAAQTRRDTIAEAVKVVHGHNDPHPHLHYSACNDDIIFQLQALNETTK